ncbi:MAG: biotin--[acetyl-CoA-carboxylase] ligase [Spirochaetaceae bacterium]|jgi:BirA family biotin operon repressor/biotin-[acetyl-CoA-carboxylase] ligase|nr:biotin--[acetyl-CoA-carboxylase] ligase [Spirochaetaceae bacterium]
MRLRDYVLSALEDAAGESVSGEALARSYGVTRAAVWKAVDRLRKSGCPITGFCGAGSQSGGGGYVLDPSYDPLDARRISAALKALEPASGGAAYCLPDESRLYVFSEIESTNTWAKKQAAEKGETLHGTVFLAERQTAGHGRLGRPFFSPASGLYLSIVFCPRGPINPAHFTAAAAVAVCMALGDLYNADCRIKWVNDIFLKGKKVCGILCEGIGGLETGRVEAVVAGIGINLREPSGGFPPEIAHVAGAVLTEAASAGWLIPTRRNELAAAVIRYALKFFSDENLRPAMLEEYRRRSLILGREVTVHPLAGVSADGEDGSYRARAVAITDDAALVVQTPDGGQRVLQAGEVSLGVH